MKIGIPSDRGFPNYNTSDTFTDGCPDTPMPQRLDRNFRLDALVATPLPENHIYNQQRPRFHPPIRLR